MKLILLKRIKGLGELGERVVVKPGYGRNYLLPQGMAIAANAENVATFESKKVELEKKAAEELKEAQQHAEALSKLELTISARVSEDNKLYGSIGSSEIVEAIVAKGLQVSRQEVQLPEGPFRAVGDYQVTLGLLNGEVEAAVKLSVVAAS